ncbi:hypothetical protein HMPREF3289_25575 [Pseudomonas sp. HMSC75E02]|nr:hypothetical protein HMPREF3289_25575 [Pseudomonas sp. HMSC75E02]
MRRHLTQPLHAGVFHRHRRVEAFGDGVRDDGLALFLEQFDQALLLFDQRVDAGGFVVEEAGDLGLFFKRRRNNSNIT